MIKVVLDTNTAISGLLDYAAPREIIILTYKRQIQLWGSKRTYSEFCRVVCYPRLEKRILYKYLTISSIEREYSSLVNIVDTTNTEISISIDDDPDDEEFIKVALEVNADYLISRDNHLLSQENYDSIPIIRPSIFMNLWRSDLQSQKSESISELKKRWKVWGSSRR